MTVCNKCAKLASEYWEEKPIRRTKVATKPLTRTIPSFSGKRSSTSKVAAALELVDDYRLRVRRARESLGLTHEDLGTRISEKVSVLRKIESGKMVPDHGVAEKLEHALKVKLLVPPSEPKAPITIPSHPREITLGEMIQVKRRKTEEIEEREQ